MRWRSLVFLGGTPGAENRGEAGSALVTLLWEGEPLRPGARIELRRRRSPWRTGRPVVRVILGSDRRRADVLLEGPGVEGDHARLYLSREGIEVNDFRVVRESDARVNGRPVRSGDWTPLASGDELSLGPWRFRFEIEEGSEEA